MLLADTISLIILFAGVGAWLEFRKLPGYDDMKFVRYGKLAYLPLLLRLRYITWEMVSLLSFVNRGMGSIIEFIRFFVCSLKYQDRDSYQFDVIPSRYNAKLYYWVYFILFNKMPLYGFHWNHHKVSFKILIKSKARFWRDYSLTYKGAIKKYRILGF